MTPIEQIKAALRFDDYAGRYLDIRANKSRCPVHDEKTASFVIHAKYGKCFGCGWHCDVITFAAEYHQMSTGAAIRMLADELGLPRQRQTALHPYDAAKAARIRAEAEEWRRQARAAMLESMHADDWDRVAPFLARLEALGRIQALDAYTAQRTPEQAELLRESIRETELWAKAITPLLERLIAS